MSTRRIGEPVRGIIEAANCNPLFLGNRSMFQFLSRLMALGGVGALMGATMFSGLVLAQNAPGAAQSGSVGVSNVSVTQAESYMKANGFSAETIQGVLALSKFIDEKKASGGVAPNEAITIFPGQPVLPNGSGLEQLVAGGSKLPKKSFLEVTKQEKLTAENFNSVVNALFDPTDMDFWLATDGDGNPISVQKLANEKEQLVRQKERWLAKLPELVTAGQQEVITKWFTYFNVIAAKAIHGSREEFRQGLIATNSMANFSTISPDKKEVYSPLVARGAAQYVLLTDPAAKLIHVERSFNPQFGNRPTVKYLVANDASLSKAGFAEGSTVNGLALEYWNKDQKKIYELNARVAGAKAELSGAKAELSGAEACLAKSTADVAKSTADVAKSTADVAKSTAEVAKITKAISVNREFNDLQDITINLSKTIQEQFDHLQARRGDKAFILTLKSNLQSWKELKVKVDRLVTSEDGIKYIVKDNRDTIVSLLNRVLLNAKLNGLD